MFDKIHYVFYDILFEIYGSLAEYYSECMKEDEENASHWERKLRKCVEKREDILDIMFTLKGIA